MYINGTKCYAFLCGLFCLLAVTRSSAQTVTINSPYIDTILCPGGTFSVAYTVTGAFTGGNTFTVQLSNAAGSFVSPSSIGFVSSTTSGTIPCTVPGGAPTGTAYRIRIVASNPAYISATDPKNIAIVNPLPHTTASGTSPVCAGAAGIELTDAATYAVNSYSWSGPNGFTSGIQNTSVPGPITAANAGTYSVTTTHTGCPSSTATVNIIVNTNIPPTPNLTNSGHCDGSPLYLYANPDTTASPISYTWSGPNGFTSSLQNPSIAVATGLNTGYYYFTDTIYGCPSYLDSIYVGISPTTPVSINITVTPNDTVCQGTSVTFTAYTTTGGVSPGFQWVNGTTPVVGAVYSTWTTSTLTDGDIIYCDLSSSINCPSPDPAPSNSIKMNIISHAPQAYIIPSPGTSVTPGSTVSFVSVIYDAGTSPSYQWYLNGVAVPGEINSTYTSPGIIGFDTITLKVTSNLSCSFPDSGWSNTVIVHDNTVGVANVATSLNNIELFPNPNNGNFTIKGNIDMPGDVNTEVLNMLGQTVYTDHINATGYRIEKTMSISNLPAGVYILHLSQEGVTRNIRFTVQR